MTKWHVLSQYDEMVLKKVKILQKEELKMKIFFFEIIFLFKI